MGSGSRAYTSPLSTNSSCLQNLRSKIDNKNFSACSESVVDFNSLKEMLEKTVKEAKVEVEDANQMISKVVSPTIGNLVMNSYYL